LEDSSLAVEFIGNGKNILCIDSITGIIKLQKNITMKRREFLEKSAIFTASMGLAHTFGCTTTVKDPLFKLSLAEWSINSVIFDNYIQDNGYEKFFARIYDQNDNLAETGAKRNLDFPAMARKYEIEAVEYVNTCFFHKAEDSEYLSELKNRCNGEGIKSLLIMVDAQGDLGDPDESKRTSAIENHYKWIDAAKFLDCHSIRVNAASQGTYDEQMQFAADGLSRLGEYGKKAGINVLVENHGGLSSNGQWLSSVMKMINMKNVGTLPDFGNFMVSSDPEEMYDRYTGVKELMPFAKAVSAKATRFDDAGNEIDTDYVRMMKIVLDAGYRGYVGIESETPGMTAEEGIMATKKLLEKTRSELTGNYS